MPPKAKGKRSVDPSTGAVTVRGKAANREGSVYVEADGSWWATYTVPGEARPRRVWARTRAEAIGAATNESLRSKLPAG